MALISIDKEALEDRMAKYLDPTVSNDEVRALYPSLMMTGNRIAGPEAREKVSHPTDQVSHPRIKPRALKPGDTIGVVSPASAIDREHLERGVASLKSLGFRVKVSSHALDRAAIVAGPDATRAGELQAFFADPEVDAIFAARGGYGAGRILPLLDFAAIARTPKIFMGFSDATFLLNALVGRAGMVCFHGPMVAMDFARGLG